MNMINPVVSGLNASTVAHQPPVPAVEPSMKTENNSSTGAQTQSGHQPQQRVHENQVEQRLPDNEVILAGPSPAFEASLLELEADIDNVIKRVHADREKARDIDAVSVAPTDAKASEAEETPPIQATATDKVEPNPYGERTESQQTGA